jgi:hypothetical protein
VLQRHSQDCPFCRLVLGIEGRDSENHSGAFCDSTTYV